MDNSGGGDFDVSMVSGADCGRWKASYREYDRIYRLWDAFFVRNPDGSVAGVFHSYMESQGRQDYFVSVSYSDRNNPVSCYSGILCDDKSGRKPSEKNSDSRGFRLQR